jgi:hypothetical protein
VSGPLERSESSARRAVAPAVGLEHVAPTIGKWVGACFPGGIAASEDQILELVREAAEAARSDYGVASTLSWADGYEFPPGAVESDVECLRAAGYDFEVMV